MALLLALNNEGRHGQKVIVNLLNLLKRCYVAKCSTYILNYDTNHKHFILSNILFCNNPLSQYHAEMS